MAALPELRAAKRGVGEAGGGAPLNCDSGKHKGKLFTWGGRADVRCALIMAALSAARYNPVIKTFYDRLLGKDKPKKVALMVRMYKILIILNVIMKSGKPWNEHHFSAKAA